jgi:hypothetical protein
MTLGIPTVRDRVVQMAALFDTGADLRADFEDCSYGFRPGTCGYVFPPAAVWFGHPLTAGVSQVPVPIFSLRAEHGLYASP